MKWGNYNCNAKNAMYSTHYSLLLMVIQNCYGHMTFFLFGQYNRKVNGDPDVVYVLNISSLMTGIKGRLRIIYLQYLRIS